MEDNKKVDEKLVVNAEAENDIGEWVDRCGKKCKSTYDLKRLIEKIIRKVGNDNVSSTDKAVAIGSLCAVISKYIAKDLDVNKNSAVWEYVYRYGFEDNYCGMRLVDYDDFLHYKNTEVLEKIIPEDVFQLMRIRSEELLDAFGNTAEKEQIEHWTNIVNGEVPFGYKLFKNN